MKNAVKRILQIGMILILFLILQPYLNPHEIPSIKGVANHGLMDLSTVDLEHTLIELTGTIESYPNQLLSHSDFKALPKTSHDGREWTPLPATWKARDGVHTATQRLMIKGLEPGRTYGVQTLEALTAFSVHADGKLIVRNGIVAADPKDARPASDPCIGLFKAQSSEAELIFQVSNHESDLTGLWQKIHFSTSENIIAYQEELVRIDAFIYGCILIMSLYHWILYLIMRKDKAILCFAAACTLIAIKGAFSGQQFGFVWYPFISYGVGIRIAYLTIPWIAQAILSFAEICFPDEIKRFYVKAFRILAILQTLVILFTPQSFYQGTFVGFQILILIECGMITFWSIQAIRHHREGAAIYLAGFVSLFITAANDILYNLMLLKTGYYLSIGLLVLILTQSAIIAIRFRRAVLTEEQLKNHLGELVEERTRQLEEERNQYEHLSKVDSLTHLYNKRFLTESLEIEFESFHRYRSIFSAIMIDIDLFKNVNDTYGHLVGDEVLAEFADILRRNTRRTDIVGRFGGEEFLIIMRYTNLAEAMVHAETLRLQIEEAVFETKAGPLKITASFGVAEIQAGMAEENEIVASVDIALYKAKRLGRNRVEAIG